MERGLENLALRRIDQAGCKTGFGDLLGHCFRRDNEHFVRDSSRLRGEHGHAQRGENIDVVTLSGHKRAPFYFHRRERTTARENSAAGGPPVRLLSRAL